MSFDSILLIFLFQLKKRKIRINIFFISFFILLMKDIFINQFEFKTISFQLLSTFFYFTFIYYFNTWFSLLHFKHFCSGDNSHSLIFNNNSVYFSFFSLSSFYLSFKDFEASLRSNKSFYSTYFFSLRFWLHNISLSFKEL